jgi:hypothetical protein
LAGDEIGPISNRPAGCQPLRGELRDGLLTSPITTDPRGRRSTFGPALANATDQQTAQRVLNQSWRTCSNPSCHAAKPDALLPQRSLGCQPVPHASMESQKPEDGVSAARLRVSWTEQWLGGSSAGDRIDCPMGQERVQKAKKRRLLGIHFTQIAPTGCVLPGSLLPRVTRAR